MSFFDVQTPMFRPLWLRVVLVALCLGWAVFEATTGAVFWAILFGTSGAYLGYQFFVVFDPDRKTDGE